MFIAGKLLAAGVSQGFPKASKKIVSESRWKPNM